MGMTVPDVKHAADRKATIPLDQKRLILQAAVQQGGYACLPLLGRGLHQYSMDPTHLALTNGQSAHSCFVRWQRLERYIHSRHQVDILEMTPSSVAAVHRQRSGDIAPLAVEDLVVCGVLSALLEANNLSDVRTCVAGVELYPDPNPKEVESLVRQGHTATWRFSWRTSVGALISQDRVASWRELAPPLWSTFASDVGAKVVETLPEYPSVAELAAQLGRAPRTFQRDLASEGLSYSVLLAEVRFRMAGWYLINTAYPIAEIGFICGFSDQAHFTRDYGRRVGLTPAKYRVSFTA
jgi:AraC-like DNA-binding protein